MTWRDKTGPARFRTATFHCPPLERGGGRALVAQGVVGSEKPTYQEDTGQKSLEFSLEGYVIGEEYEAERDALIAALRTPGVGELFHPLLGLRRVVVPSFKTREDTSKEGGICRFFITFIEAEEAPVAPVAVVDAAGSVADAAANARTSVSARFMALYASTARYRTAVTGALTSATREIDKLTAIKELAVQDLARLQLQIADLTDSAEALVDAPAELLASVVDVVSDLAQSLVSASQIPASVSIGFQTAVGVRAPFRALLALFDFDPGPRPGDGTETAAAEQRSYDALQQLVQRSSLIASSEAALSEQFDSYDAALEARDQIVSRIDQHTEDVADDTYESFMALRAALVAALPGEESDLPRLVDITPPSTVASLVLAHRLYGSVDLEADLVRRNNIRDPALILGGRALEVLSNG